MNVRQKFTHTKGSIIGSTHRNNFKNNQDFHWVIEDENSIIAIVADGCGSGAHSEVGAGLITPIIADKIKRFLQDNSIEDSIRLSFESIVEFIKDLSPKYPLNQAETIENFFLFTIVGAIITKDETVIFTVGDGVYAINGSIHVIDQNNAPNYLGYYTLKNTSPEFTINVKMPTEAVDSIIIASDGATDIIKNQDQQVKFGLQMKKVGNLTQFIEGDMRGSSIRMVKHLNVLSKQNMVSDDTTIITIVKTPEGE